MESNEGFNHDSEDDTSAYSQKTFLKNVANVDSTINLDEFLNCYICFNKVLNAVMCPFCSKLCCSDCIIKWLTQRQQCPHCRSSLRVSQLVNCRFVADISAAIDKIKLKQNEEEKCPTHNQPLIYFCNTCNNAICSDCAMFGNTHKDHQFQHLSKVYNTHVDRIKQQAAIIKNRLSILNRNLEIIEKTIDKVTKGKEDKVNEINIIVEQILNRLETQLKSKLLTLLAQKGSMNDEIEYLQHLQSQISNQISFSAKSVLVSKSSDIIKVLKEVEEKPTQTFEKDSISTEFTSELVPDYDNGIFVIHNYSKIRYCEEIIYSDCLQTTGLTWRLKVYPNGNGIAKGSYLSIFLEMVKGLTQTSKYEYRVEMINHKNPKMNVIRYYLS